MDNIKIGDEVRLKSGGPIMTVKNIGDYLMSAGVEDGVMCVWFVGDTLKEEVFERQTLVAHNT